MSFDPPPPPTSDERRRYHRLGEALLAADGRLPQAPRTIAIQLLADRMRSSTLELALAATGLVVGSDMAGRLGDGRYVLVVPDERHPSSGAEVLHSDELRTESHRPAARRAVRMDSEKAERLVRTIAVGELVDAWTHGSSRNVRSLALQEITRDEFGVRGREVPARDRRKVDLELRYNRDALTDFLRTQYAVTQEMLAARGISDVISYRAYIWRDAAARPLWADDDRIGGVVEAPQWPLASWSPDRQVIEDWMKGRQDHGVILAVRHPASEIVSLPVTGMGSSDRNRWVVLSGDQRAVVDSPVFVPRISERERPATAGPGRPAPSEPAPTAPAPSELAPTARPGWQPQTVAGRVSAPDQLDLRIGRILDGRDEAPAWWVRDDSGYGIARRDLEFLRIEPHQLRWMLTGEAPMGLTPKLYRQFAAGMQEALQQDGVDARQVDIRLKGTAAGFFSGLHKTLPTEAELAGRPAAVDRMREWFGGDGNRPLRRPYDAMYRLGLEAEPSDYDLDINSTAAVRAARAHWRDNHGDRYPGDFLGGHGYLDKQSVREALAHVADWAARWEDKLGRPVSLGVFESAGPFDEAALGRKLSAHFRDSDWIIHRAQKFAGPRRPSARGGPVAVRPDHHRRGAAEADRGATRTARERGPHR